MKGVNFIGIELNNPNWGSICRLITSKLSDWIAFDKLNENNWSGLFEIETHITLVYSPENLPIGPNYTDVLLKIISRDYYNQLRSDLTLNLNDVVIDTFNNTDAKVLKINVESSDKYELLKNYRDHLITKLDLPNYDYNPHITITYLKPDTPDSLINEVISEVPKSNLRLFNMTNFIISNKEDEKVKYKIG